VDNCKEWKEAFKKANSKNDSIYLPTNGAISGWNESEAITFIRNYIKKPVVTCDDFMMSYAVLGLTKITEEQGEWVAKEAMEVYNGKSISQVALTQNNKSEV
jgi:hypothetical protein